MDAPRPPSLLLRLIARRSVLLSMVVLVRPGCVHALSVRRNAVADGGLAGGAGVPLLPGTALGVVAGYVRRLDGLLMRLTDAMMAFPDILTRRGRC